MFYKNIDEFCNDWGYNKFLSNIKDIMQIFDIIMKNKLNLKEEYIIVNEKIYEQIRDIESHKLKKKVTNWARKNCKYKFKDIITEEDFRIMQEKQKQQELKKEQLKQQQIELDEFLQKQKKYLNQWKDTNWINKNIGVYCTESQIYEYYWSIIGDNYKKANWKGDILIEENIYNQIKDMKNPFLKGRTFLNRTFEHGGYSHKIIGTYKNFCRNNAEIGIYGIYQDGVLVYIGKTQRSFEERWKEHLDVINGVKEQSNMVLYKILDKDKDIEFRPLIRVKDIKVEGELTTRDIESMELALITLYQPVGNYQGVKNNYVFN